MSSQITILYDTIRAEEKALYEAGKRKGVNTQMVDCKEIFLNLNNHNTMYGQKNEKTQKQRQTYDTVIQRCVSYYRSLHSTAALEGLGNKIINCLNTSIFAGNKLFTHMLLQKAGVPTPASYIAFSKDAALEALEETGYPMVIKPTVGSWGRMISLLRDRESAEGIMESRERMYPIYQVYYLEEFVRRPPRDIRAIMVGDKVVAAIYRYSGDERWKTNMALGGKAEEYEVTNELEDICIRAKNTVQGEIVGVDLMESDKDGLVVHEVNNTTEFKNTVRITGVDIAGMMIDYAIQQTKKR